MTFEYGILTVRADSTAWTTQLKLLESSIMARLEGEVGKGTVTALKIVGPSAPSWSKGFRRSSGPGPARHLRLRRSAPAPAARP